MSLQNWSVKDVEMAMGPNGERDGILKVLPRETVVLRHTIQKFFWNRVRSAKIRDNSKSSYLFLLRKDSWALRGWMWSRVPRTDEHRRSTVGGLSDSTCDWRSLQKRATLSKVSRAHVLTIHIPDALRQSNRVSSLQISVFHATVLQGKLTVDQPVTVGRQDPTLGDPSPVKLHKRADEARLVVARANITSIPRRWFRVSSDPNGWIVVENLHSLCELNLLNDAGLLFGQSRSFEHEVSIDLGYQIVLQVSVVKGHNLGSNQEYRRLNSVPPVPGKSVALDSAITIRQLPELSGAATVELLKIALQVVQHAAGSDAFFQKAVDATAQIVGLERAIVLMRAATKQLEVDCMISGRTAADAGCLERARRLAKLNVVGIEQPIDVYQVVHQFESDWETLVSEYQAALSDFEEGRSGSAARRLGELIQRYPNDRPCRQLLARTAEHLNGPSGVINPIWKLSKK